MELFPIGTLAFSQSYKWPVKVIDIYRYEQEEAQIYKVKFIRDHGNESCFYREQLQPFNLETCARYTDPSNKALCMAIKQAQKLYDSQKIKGKLEKCINPPLIQPMQKQQTSIVLPNQEPQKEVKQANSDLLLNSLQSVKKILNHSRQTLKHPQKRRKTQPEEALEQKQTNQYQHVLPSADHQKPNDMTELDQKKKKAVKKPKTSLLLSESYQSIKGVETMQPVCHPQNPIPSIPEKSFNSNMQKSAPNLLYCSPNLLINQIENELDASIDKIVGILPLKKASRMHMLEEIQTSNKRINELFQLKREFTSAELIHSKIINKIITTIRCCFIAKINQDAKICPYLDSKLEVFRRQLIKGEDTCQQLKQDLLSRMSGLKSYATQ